MHVLHVIDALALGGAERMLVEIANRAARDGHRITVCVTRHDTRMAHLLDANIELLVLGRTRRIDLAPMWRLRQWIARSAVDVIHAHGRSSFSLIAALRATRAIATPVILHDHLGVHIHPEVPRWFEIARRFLDAYVAVDEAQLAWAARAGIARDRMHVIANALDLAALAARTRDSELSAVAGPRLLCIGGLRRDKAIDVVLEAMTHVAATLFVVGGDADPAYAAACRARAARPDLASRIVFLGERGDALPLARTVDLAVHGARSESGPLVLAEYASLEIPFVATRVGAIAEALAAVCPQRFVPAEDPEALARAITAALAMPAAQRAREVAAAAQLARARFEISNVIAAWYEVYERVRV